MFENLKSGNKVSISFEKNVDKTYTSYLETVYENELLIYNPVKDNKLINLPIDKNITYIVRIYTEKGIYSYHNVCIRKRISKEDYQYLLLENFEPLVQEERREFYRLNCMVPFLIKDKNDETYQAIIKDISEGGLLFVSNLDMHPAEERECSVSLNNERISMIIKLLAKRDHEKPGCKFEYRSKLLFVSEEDKNVLLDFIFNAQRNYIRQNQNDANT